MKKPTGRGGKRARVATGLDRLLADPSRLAGRRYGVLGHGASITAAGRPIHLELKESPADAPSALFGPEHGFYGIEQDMVPAAGGTDSWTGAPIVSLYGDSEDSLRPDPGAFEGLDLLVIDLQDVGSRYYTYAATAVWAAEVALASGAEVWVLDRPNPLGGDEIEGNLLEPGFESFVGAFRLPVRHGLTLGELVRLEARRRDWDEEGLQIWEMEGWERSMSWEETGLPWIAPSPNMPTPATALVYPGTCLIEATDLSEGRGTTRPFLLFGTPGLHPVKLAESLEEKKLPGITFLPTYFRPQFQKHAGKVCGGVELIVTDRRAFRPYRLGIELLSTVRLGWDEAYPWRLDPYEFVDDRPAIDLLTGTSIFRRSIDDWDAHELSEWLRSWDADEEEFRREREDILLYPEKGV
jgi:uncharacterized protein YbbC (DUF1343 family)